MSQDFEKKPQESDLKGSEDDESTTLPKGWANFSPFMQKILEENQLTTLPNIWKDNPQGHRQLSKDRESE